MSLVDEHYTRVFRLLASGLLSQTNSQDSGSSLRSGDQSAASGPDSKLVVKAFDLSTRLLTEPKCSSVSGSPRAVEGHVNSSGRDQQAHSLRPVAPRSIVACPPLSGIVEDLELVHEVNSHVYDAVNASEQRSATDLVLINAVATIHAHAIQQLLESVLPLSTDIDYWSAQDSGPLPLSVYFIQSLPQRLYRWSTQVVRAISAHTVDHTTHKHSMLEQMRMFMTSRYLFPVADQADAAHENLRGRRAALRFSKVPDRVNILGLVGHEIRYKRQQLVLMQDKLASSIGMLSLAASGKGGSVTAEDLLWQVSNAINTATGCEATLAENEDVWLDGNVAAQALLVRNAAERIPSIFSSVSHRMKSYSRPSLATRCWIPAVVLLASARWLSSYVTEHRDDFKDWIVDGIFTLRNYISQYILTPLRSGYETIRYGKHTYSVMSDESLASDFQSLEEMVIGFAKRFGAVNPAEVRYRVENGDLSDVMQVYSHEMQKPFRNAVFGDLVQAMLIQVQKVKVDVGQTMAALDKLLKSNELNFLLLSTVPATLSIYAASTWLSARVSWWISGSSRHTVSSIQTIVRDIDRLLNSGAETGSLDCPAGVDILQLPAISQGHLVCLTHYLRHHAQMLPNSASAGRLQTGAGWSSTLPHTRTMFLQDIRDIESANLNIAQKQNVVQRMYRTFRFL